MTRSWVKVESASSLPSSWASPTMPRPRICLRKVTRTRSPALLLVSFFWVMRDCVPSPMNRLMYVRLSASRSSFRDQSLTVSLSFTLYAVSDIWAHLERARTQPVLLRPIAVCSESRLRAGDGLRSWCEPENHQPSTRAGLELQRLTPRGAPGAHQDLEQEAPGREPQGPLGRAGSAGLTSSPRALQ